MTTNQTIDGVPRELVERIADPYRREPRSIHLHNADIAELRALLDATEFQYDGFTAAQAHAVSAGVDELLFGKPADQPQGEPVAWLMKCKNSGVFEQAEPNEKSSNPMYWTDAFPVYAELPAPVAVVITDEQILESMRRPLNDADGGYVVDTSPEKVIEEGRSLISCLDEVKRLNL